MGRKKFGGREVLFGDEAIANRLAVELYRPLADGVIKDDDVHQQAVEDLIEHVISLAQPRPGQKIFAVIGAPAQASIQQAVDYRCSKEICRFSDDYE